MDNAAMTDHLNELLGAVEAKRAEFTAALEPQKAPADIPGPALALMRHEVRTVLRNLFEAEILIENAAAAAVRLEMLGGAYQEETA